MNKKYKNVNLHISTHNSLSNPSRILKETKSLIDNDIFDHVIILGKYSSILPSIQKLDDYRTIIRLGIWRKKLVVLNERMQSGFFWIYIRKIFLLHKISGILDFITIKYQLVNIYRMNNISCINIHSYEQIQWGVKLSKKFNAKLVYDIHELESQRAGLSIEEQKKIRSLEFKNITSMDSIICVSEEIKHWYLQEYNKIQIPVVVRNIPAQWQNINNEVSFRDIFNISDDKTIILYNGGLSKERAIDIILEVASHPRLKDNFVFIFMGYGPMEVNIIKNELYGNRIFFQEAVPPSEIVKYTMGADLGISIFLNISLSYNYALPNKLFEYLAAGIGLIGGVTETQKKFIIDNQVGTCANVESVDEYVRILNNLTPDLINKYKQNAKKLRHVLTWENEVKIMIEEYNRFMSNQ